METNRLRGGEAGSKQAMKDVPAKRPTIDEADYRMLMESLRFPAGRSSTSPASLAGR